ncbi:DUF1178 family protein [Novosphingobium aquiterrae]|uniref:DUF1178 family protein n=1 Tax=Novosphingobium aquiterrae TaxID=624388 RepID=A0ABV6PH94_9SPHN
MIVYDLVCQPLQHRFEAWFASSQAFTDQQERGLLCCPQCGTADVVKAPMAPAVGRKGNSNDVVSNPSAVVGGTMPPAIQEVMTKLAAMQAAALKQSKWVGGDFAEQSRAMHYGERDQETIHGQASPAEAKALVQEGIAVMPLPFPVAPPDELN